MTLIKPKQIEEFEKLIEDVEYIKNLLSENIENQEINNTNNNYIENK